MILNRVGGGVGGYPGRCGLHVRALGDSGRAPIAGLSAASARNVGEIKAAGDAHEAGVADGLAATSCTGHSVPQAMHQSPRQRDEAFRDRLTGENGRSKSGIANRTCGPARSAVCFLVWALTPPGQQVEVCLPAGPRIHNLR